MALHQFTASPWTLAQSAAQKHCLVVVLAGGLRWLATKCASEGVQLAGLSS